MSTRAQHKASCADLNHVMHETVRIGDEILVEIGGAFDGAVAPGVWADVQAALESGVTRVTVDLAGANEVDDGALAVLAAIAVLTQVAGGHLFLAMGGDDVVEITDASVVRTVFDR